MEFLYYFPNYIHSINAAEMIFLDSELTPMRHKGSISNRYGRTILLMRLIKAIGGMGRRELIYNNIKSATFSGSRRVHAVINVTQLQITCLIFMISHLLCTKLPIVFTSNFNVLLYEAHWGKLIIHTLIFMTTTRTRVQTSPKKEAAPCIFAPVHTHQLQLRCRKIKLPTLKVKVGACPYV